MLHIVSKIFISKLFHETKPKVDVLKFEKNHFKICNFKILFHHESANAKIWKIRYFDFNRKLKILSECCPTCRFCIQVFFVCTLSLSLSSSTPFSTVYNNVQFHINLIFPSILGVFVISLVISTAVYRYTRQSCNPNYIKDFVTKRTSISYVLADVYLATIRTATWR